MKININHVFILMARKCMTNRDMITASGISISAWNKLKNGKSMPNPATIGKIAKALDVDVAEIIE